MHLWPLITILALIYPQTAQAVAEVPVPQEYQLSQQSVSGAGILIETANTSVIPLKSQKLTLNKRNIPNQYQRPSEAYKQELLTKAGIPEADWEHVDFILTMESGWDPLAKNKTSGAEGLPQALPYSKTGCERGDADCQMKWSHNYAFERYGSWENAHRFWLQNHWW